MKYSTSIALKYLTLIVFTFIFANKGVAVQYFSQGNLNPAALASWNTVAGGGGLAPTVFTNTGDIFTIQSPHNMVMTALWSPSGRIEIKSGATLNTSAFVLTINNGTNAIDLEVDGTLTEGTQIAYTGTPVIQFNGTGLYDRAFNGASGGIIPGTTSSTATWVAGSTCKISGVVNNSPNLGSQNFSNLTWDCTGQSGNRTIAIGSVTTFNVVNLATNQLTVNATGTIGTLNETAANGKVVLNTTITNLNMSGGGNADLNACTIGNLALSAGTAQLITAQSSVNGNFNFTGGTFTHNSIPILFNGSGNQTISGSPTFFDMNITSSGGTVSSTGTITTAQDLNLNAGAYSPAGGITVTRNLNLTAGSIALAGTNSVKGNITNNGTTITPGTSTLTLSNNAATQIIGGTTASTFNNLTTTAGGPVTINAPTTINGTLTLASKMTLGADLTMGSGAPAIAGTSASNYIVALTTNELKKVFASGSSYVYPIGDATNFTPVSATVAGGSFGGFVGFTTTDSKNTGVDLSSTDFLTRYWTMTTSGISGATVNGTATFINAASDISGTIGNITSAINNTNAANAWTVGSIVTAPTLTFSGLTTNGATFGGVDGAAPTVSTIVPSVATIIDSNVGTNTFSLTVNFSESMDQTLDPVISFPTENPTGVITFNTGSWITATQYKANYNVTDNNLKLLLIDVKVATARDLMRNVLQAVAANTKADNFNYDMSNPTATITSNLSILKDSNVGVGTFTITATYSESMNAGVAVSPSIGFPVESPGLALTLTSGIWSGGNTIYTATYNVTDINADVLNIDVSASGAQNPNGNTQTPKTQADLFNLQMLNPSLTPVTIASNNTNSTTVAKSGEQIKILFTASETLPALPTATIDGQAAVVSLISGLNYQATLTMAAFPEVAVPIVINFTDASGNTGTVNATTDGSSVLYDRTAPTNENAVYGTGGTILGGKTQLITASLAPTDKIWFAPAGKTIEGTFIVGATMTKAASGSATSILAPTTAGNYQLYVIDLAGNVSAASTATLVVNNTPILAAIEVGAQTYTENGAGVAVTSTTTVDDDGINMSGATIQITGNYSNGNDVLTYTTTAGVAGAWNAATGTMTLSGALPVASYQAAIRAVTFTNTSDNPSILARTLTILATDATPTVSNTVTRTLNVTAVNDPPAFSTTAVLAATATSLYVYDVNATDVDNTLAFANFSMTTGPVWLALTNAGTGLARLSGTPPVGTSGPINVTINCSDGSGGSTNQTFVINVTNATVVDGSGAGNYLTLQAAVNAVPAGTKIIVNAGTYTENVVITKNLNIEGASAATTIFDGNCAGSVIQVISATVTFKNMTVQNGCGTLAVQADAHGPQAYYGGGFYIYGGTVTMTSLIIRNNNLAKYGPIGGSGGGVYMGTGSTVTMTGVSITANVSNLYRGAGLCMERSVLNLDNTCSITGNGSCNYGAGICSWSSTLNINGANITGNTTSGPNPVNGVQILALGSIFTTPAAPASNNTFFHLP